MIPRARGTSAPARSKNNLRAALPLHAPGMRIGLFGGTFNPAHEAHRAASLFALKRLRLDRVWWLVTPGNPLKDRSGLPPAGEREAAARAFANDSRIDVTGFEAVIGSQYSADTMAHLRRECPDVHFVWIMGADNLRGLHRWKKWRQFVSLVPIAVVDRGGVTLAARAAPAIQALARARLPESAASRLALATPPAWVYLHGLKMQQSSTAIRAAKKNGAAG